VQLTSHSLILTDWAVCICLCVSMLQRLSTSHRRSDHTARCKSVNIESRGISSVLIRVPSVIPWCALCPLSRSSNDQLQSHRGDLVRVRRRRWRPFIGSENQSDRLNKQILLALGIMDFLCSRVPNYIAHFRRTCYFIVSYSLLFNLYMDSFQTRMCWTISSHQILSIEANINLWQSIFERLLLERFNFWNGLNQFEE